LKQSLRLKDSECWAGARSKPINSALGETAKRAEPKMRMVFIARNPHIATDMDFERKLFLIRKRAENEIRYGAVFEGGKFFYIASLSYKTLVYKGMLVSNQLGDISSTWLTPIWKAQWRWCIRVSAPIPSPVGNAPILIGM